MKNLVKSVIIFGAGGVGRRLHDLMSLEKQNNIIAFIDNDSAKHNTYYKGTVILHPEKLKNLEFDEVHFGSAMGVNELGVHLIKLGVPQQKIKNDYIISVTNARKIFLQRFSEEFKPSLNPRVCVAEAGVYRGEFASQINRCFGNQKLFLFDTFEGFDDRDFQYESDESLLQAEHFKATTTDLVLSKMDRPDMCLFKKGYFPESAHGIDEKFAFVSLDLDLYKPTFEGLRFFYPKMIIGGCVLIHDYFTPSYPNVRKAVEDYKSEHEPNLKCLPIGDDCSIAIIK